MYDVAIKKTTSKKQKHHFPLFAFDQLTQYSISGFKFTYYANWENIEDTLAQTNV